MPNNGSVSRWWWLPAIICGAAFTWSYSTRWLWPGIDDDPWVVAGYTLYLLVGGTALGGWLLRRLAGAWRSAARVPMFLAFLGCGVLATAVVPSRISTEIPVRHTVTITATGERNPASQGTEVWVLDVPGDVPAGAISEHVALAGDWEQRENALISHQTQPATMAWEGWHAGDNQFTLLMHPWSGIAEINMDGEVQRVDLYSVEGGRYTFSPTADTGIQQAIGIATFLSDSLLFALLIGGAFTLLGRGRLALEPAAPGQFGRTWLILSVICAALWGLYLLVFWPGLFSSDSSDQWLQIMRGQFNDAHPAFHSVLNWLITRVWFSPAAIAVVQIGFLSCMVGWGLAIAREHGASRNAVFLACVICGLAPVNGLIVIALWKDLFYSAAVIGLCLMAFRIATSKGAWLYNGWHLVALLGLCVIASLTRHNGVAAAFGTPLVLMVFVLRPARLRLALIFVATLGLWWLIRGPIYAAMGVQRLEDPRFALAPLLSQLAAHVKSGTPLSASEQAYVDSIRSTSEPWPEACYTIDTLFYGDAVNWSPIVRDPDQFVRLVIDLGVRNPGAVVAERACRTSVIWSVDNPAPGSTYYAPINLDANGVLTMNHPAWVLELWSREFPQVAMPEPASWAPDVALFIAYRYAESISGWTDVFWRPALYTYLLLFVIAVTCWRSRSLRPLAYLVPLALHTALLVALLPAQDSRYMYPAMGLAFATWPMLLAGQRTPK